MLPAVIAVRRLPAFVLSHGFTRSGRIAALPLGLLTFKIVATIADVWPQRLRLRPSAMSTNSRIVSGPGSTPTAPAIW